MNPEKWKIHGFPATIGYQNGIMHVNIPKVLLTADCLSVPSISKSSQH
jgi:hypothetical protein